MKNHLVQIGDQLLDYNSLEDSIVLQSALLPKGFRGEKTDAVRLFLNYRSMLQAQFDRHLLNNWPKILRGAADMVDDNEQPILACAFAFEVNMTAPTVAAIGKTKMAGRVPFSSIGAAQTHDINQGDLFESLDSLDPTSPSSIAAQRDAEEKEAAEADEAKRIRDEEKAAAAAAKEQKKAAALDDANALAATEPVEKPKKAPKKKVAKKTKN